MTRTLPEPPASVVARDVDWAPVPNTVTVAFDSPPAGAPVTSAFATRTADGVQQMLLVQVRERASSPTY